MLDAPYSLDEHYVSLLLDSIQEIASAATPSINLEQVAPSESGGMDPAMEAALLVAMEPDTDFTPYESHVAEPLDSSPATDSEPLSPQLAVAPLRRRLLPAWTLATSPPPPEAALSVAMEPDTDFNPYESRVAEPLDSSLATDSEPPASVPIESDWAPIMEFTSVDIFQHSPLGDVLNSLRSLSLLGGP